MAAHLNVEPTPDQPAPAGAKDEILPTDGWYVWPRRRPISLVGRPPQSLTERLRMAAEEVGRTEQPRLRADATTEFALLAPLLCLVLFGIMEVGRVVDASVVVKNAAREGARVGARSYPDSATAGANAAATYLASALGMRTDVVSGQVEARDASSEIVEVTAEAHVELYTPIIRSVFQNRLSLPVSSTARMRKQ